MTPRQFSNIDEIDKQLPRQNATVVEFMEHNAQSLLEEIQPKLMVPEIVIPSLHYKLNLTKKSRFSSLSSTLLPIYAMPSLDILNTWIVFLESILKEVFSIEGSE
jgi:hypothetical protein